MKILMINVVCGVKSTGRICTDLADELTRNGHTVKIAYGREKVPQKYKQYAVRVGNDIDVKLHAFLSRLTDSSGFYSTLCTKRFIKWVKEFNPDVIHLHNIHGYYINVKILFDYLRKCEKKIIWTLHDCWAFTGHASYCEGVNCLRWKDGCFNCFNKKDYPKSFIDKSRRNWIVKKELFCGIPKLTIVTPSQWLSNLVKQSFLSEYSTSVIYNEINTTIFKNCESKIKQRYAITDKKIVLGVASIWTKRKGLQDFIKLSLLLPSNYQIVIVGVSKKQKKQLPANIVAIDRTDSVQELVEFYNSADVFVNPTYEDNYPTTNIEAIACWIPVITYDTGGSPESAKYYGAVVNKGDVEGILSKILKNSFIDNRYSNIFGEGKWLKQYCELY